MWATHDEVGGGVGKLGVQIALWATLPTTTAPLQVTPLPPPNTQAKKIKPVNQPKQATTSPAGS